MEPQSEEERQIQEAIALSLQQQQGEQAPQPMDTERSEDSELRMALELSMQQPSLEGSAPAPPPLDPESDGLARIDAATAQEADAGGPALSTVIFGDAPAPEVTRQWRMQGFNLADVDVSDAPGVTPFGAGLAQINGGPCAILAAAQAYMLRRLLFSGDAPSVPPTPTPAWREEAEGGDGALLPTEAEAGEALLRGLADIFVACATTPSASASAVASSGGAAAELPPTACQVVLAIPTAAMLDDGIMAHPSPALLAALVTGAARPSSWAETLESLRARRQGLSSEIGALAILVSALLTRGVGRFSEERDDVSQPLLDAQFGHCSQEVLNLLLVRVGCDTEPRRAHRLSGSLPLLPTDTALPPAWPAVRRGRLQRLRRREGPRRRLHATRRAPPSARRAALRARGVALSAGGHNPATWAAACHLLHNSTSRLRPRRHRWAPISSSRCTRSGSSPPSRTTRSSSR